MWHWDGRFPRVAIVAAWSGEFVLVLLFVIANFSSRGFDAIEDIANLGRERQWIANLTGRTEIWHDLMPDIYARPWLGYGYESFWTPARLEKLRRQPGLGGPRRT